MDNTITISYRNRASGTVECEYVYAGGFLRWLYNSLTGRMASYLLFRHALASRLYGLWTRLPASHGQIETLVRSDSVERDECVEPIGGFSTFNDFFIREIDLARRPMPANPAACSSPVDGKVLAFPRIDRRSTFQIKRHTFNLDSFLQDSDLAERFDRGSMLVCRLSLADYHHFHFPDGGWPGRGRTIPGSLHAGGPYSRRSLLPYYAVNRRSITPFLSDHFGPMLIAEIGALTVGSIVQEFKEGERTERGCRKGHFELGGSTVVLLFQKNAIHIDEDLITNTAAGLETRISMGESLGIAVATASYANIREEPVR